MKFVREGRSQAAIDGCYVCPMCRHQCTTSKATRQETDSPRSKALSLYGLQRGIISIDSSGFVEQMYRCCGCRMCTSWCASGYEPSVMVQAARTDIAQSLKAPARVMDLLDRMQETGSPMGRPEGSRREALNGLVPAASGQAEVAWYLGCIASYEAAEQVQATGALLRASGVRWTVLPDEQCCGALAWSLGFRREAQDMAAAVLNSIEASGARTVISTCPTCTKAIGRDYSEEWGVQHRMPLQVLHASQLLAKLAAEGRLTLETPVRARAVYHDPCSLGRGMEVYEEPRAVLQAIPGLELVESRHNRDKGECCGSGAGMRFTNPEIAATAACQALEGKIASGAEIVVTSCPSCQVAFEGAKRALGAGVEVVDLFSLAARALGRH